MSAKTVTIDGQTYDAATLSNAVTQQINNLRVVDREIARLQMQLNIAQTARNTYAQALKAELGQSA